MTPSNAPWDAPASGSVCRFGELTIGYDERVLEPRPWTLAQSRWAARLAGDAPAGAILELCAGAGHIGLAAAVEAGRDLVQVEADPVAASYARANAARAGWDLRTDVRVAPMQSALGVGELFPLVIADPPYLPSDDVSRWPADPVTAIDGGPDGLDLVRACLAVAAAHLMPGGHLLLQVAGAIQAHETAALASDFRADQRELLEIDGERAVLLLTR